MISRDLKSIGYAFISNDIDIYFPDDEKECFIAEKLLCTECKSPWHTSLLECYFCGELNYYLYMCTECGMKYSITKSKVTCSCGNINSKLIKACVNEDCPTNTDEIIKKIAIKEKGVFDLKSSLNLSLTYCINCGSISNYYKTLRTFLFNMHANKDINGFLDDHHVNKGDVIIFKNKIDGEIVYDYSIHNPKVDFEPSFEYSTLNDIIDILFFQE